MKISIKKINIKKRVNENIKNKFNRTSILKKTNKLVKDKIKSPDSLIIGLAEKTSSKETEKRIKEKKINSKIYPIIKERTLKLTRAEINSGIENYSKEKTKEEVTKWTDIKIKEIKKKLTAG